MKLHQTTLKLSDSIMQQQTALINQVIGTQKRKFQSVIKKMEDLENQRQELLKNVNL